MPSKNWTKIIIGLFSAIILLTSLFTNQSINQYGFRWVSGASSAVIFLIILYDRWVWRWPLIRKVSEYYGRPIIYGTWKGIIEYEQDFDKKPGVSDIYMSIYQTYSTIQIRAYFSTSESKSLTASIDNPLQGQRRLTFVYNSESPHNKRNKNRPHDGTAILNVIGTPVEAITGSYFTDRGGTGTISLNEYSQKLSESYIQAKSRDYANLS
jgi:hypothetical protein